MECLCLLPPCPCRWRVPVAQSLLLAVAVRRSWLRGCDWKLVSDACWWRRVCGPAGCDRSSYPSAADSYRLVNAHRLLPVVPDPIPAAGREIRPVAHWVADVLRGGSLSVR